jgi:hypothetical protein
MFIKKKGLFSFLEGDRVDICCDICSTTIEGAEALKTNSNTYAVTRLGSANMICVSCFNKSIRNYRWKDFENYPSNSNCCICTADFKNISANDSNNKIRHICHHCISSQAHKQFLIFHLFACLRPAPALHPEGWYRKYKSYPI